MFDIFAKLLSSIASFLFPLFASYKALKTSDPAQLTPWLMYWVVLAIALLVESWTEWFLVWIPFYAYIRLFFLLYLVLPQTQGARVLYQTHVHPWLEDNEGAIEDLIASAHERLRAAGIAYLKQALELVKTHVFGLPPSQDSPGTHAANAAAAAAGTTQSYTQTLLARFSLPSARWAGAGGAGGGGPSTAGTGGADFYNFLASAVSAATGVSMAGGGAQHRGGSDGLVPDSILGTTARMSFIQAQRERLNLVLSALDREASQLEAASSQHAASISLDGGASGAGRNYRSFSGQSGASGGGLNKSRSEADFEKLEAESGAEEDMEGSSGLRRRTPGTAAAPAGATPGGGGNAAAGGAGGGSWMPWGWGAAAAASPSAGGATAAQPDLSRGGSGSE